jgi:Ca-activated chloride channel family protein
MDHRPLLRTVLLAVFVAVGTGCATAQTTMAQTEIRLLFLYGSEKEKWIEAVTPAFNKAAYKIPSGERIFVETKPAGSGEIISDLLKEKEGRLAHVVSPAGGAFIDLGNYQAHEDGKEDLIGKTVELVRSPIVVAMWHDLALSIGWGRRPIGWGDIFDLAREPQQWRAAVQRSGADAFRFGHTHPDFSNSGLHTLFAEVYAALGKFEGVTRRDVTDHRTEIEDYLRQVENAVVHYGSSTGFLAKKMSADGRAYLDAAILYENLVIEANQAFRAKDPSVALPQVVAIYPKEGTFPSEHPVGIVRRHWVTDRHRQAAEIYISYLKARPQQELAKRTGFRPTDPGIPISDVILPEFGVDASQPRLEIKPPQPAAYNVIADIWSRSKRPADIVVAIDCSGSMKGEKIRKAEAAAKIFIDMLREGDHVSTLIFGADVEWQAQDLRTDRAGKSEARKSVENIIPGGDTALYQAILDAYHFLEQRDRRRNRAIVVLSDGNDTKRKSTLDEVLREVRFNGKDKSIYIFTIAYGKDADPDLLAKIAKATQADSFRDTNDATSVEDIYAIFTKIATFF